jgi:hypothetical protein
MLLLSRVAVVVVPTLVVVVVPVALLNSHCRFHRGQ